MKHLRDQKKWGPHVWYFLHTLAATYTPSQQKDEMRSFLTNLPALLPCSKCGNHLREAYKSRPFDAEGLERALNSRGDLVTWVNRLHNKVSERTGGQQYPVFSVNITTQKDQRVILAVALGALAFILLAAISMQ